MNYESWLTLPSSCMVPLIVDSDSLWGGRPEDTAFFVTYKKRWFRFRNTFRGEFSQFGTAYQSVLVIRLPSYGLRLRIGLPIKRFYDSSFEASSDYRASEQLAEQCEEADPMRSSQTNQLP